MRDDSSFTSKPVLWERFCKLEPLLRNSADTSNNHRTQLLLFALSEAIRQYKEESFDFHKLFYNQIVSEEPKESQLVNPESCINEIEKSIKQLQEKIESNEKEEASLSASTARAEIWAGAIHLSNTFNFKIQIFDTYKEHRNTLLKRKKDNPFQTLKNLKTFKLFLPFIQSKESSFVAEIIQPISPNFKSTNSEKFMSFVFSNIADKLERDVKAGENEL